MVMGCDPDATDNEEDDFSGSVLTFVGGPVCLHRASQLPYISGNNLDIS